MWSARFYKTRALASEAVGGGHVHLNGSRVKAAHPVTLGDELTVRKGRVQFEITVNGLAAKRGPASVAQQLYTESEASLLARQQQADERRLLRATNPAPRKRPDKRARRHIFRFVRKNLE